MTSNYTPPRSWNTVIGRPYVTVSPSTTFDGSDYGAFTPGTTTSGIQEAVNTGKQVVLLAGTFTITTEITNGTSSVLNIIGQGYGMPADTSGYPLPTYGSIILQSTADANIIRLASPVDELQLKDFSAAYSSSIAFTSTGHGIFIDGETYANSLSSPNGNNVCMANNISLGPLYVYGVDDAHYCFWFENFNVNGSIPALIGATKGGLLKFRSFKPAAATDNSTRNAGNCVIQWLTGSSNSATTVSVVSFDQVNNSTYSSPQTNMIRVLYMDVETNGTTYTPPFVEFGSNCENLFIDLWDQADLGSATLTISNQANAQTSIAPGAGTWASGVTYSNGNGGFLPVSNLVFFGQPGTGNPAQIDLYDTGSQLTLNGALIVGNGLYSYNSGNAIRTNPSSPGTISLPTNPPASGTVYQNTSGTNIYIYLPVTYSPTSTVAATMTPALGPTSTVVDLPKESEPAGLTTGTIRTYLLRVPNSWYFSFTASNATLGTAVVVGA